MAKESKTLAPDIYSAKEFFLEDFSRTLFPLTTNRVLVEQGTEELLDYAKTILAGDGSFLPQRRVYANKDKLHLRRTNRRPGGRVVPLPSDIPESETI